MPDALQFLLFGDETGEFLKPLQRLCEHEKGILFRRYVDEVSEVLRDEVRRQPRLVKVQIPPFTDLLDLVKQYSESASRNQILETTFATLCQLASIFRFVFEDPGTVNA